MCILKKFQSQLSWEDDSFLLLIREEFTSFQSKKNGKILSLQSTIDRAFYDIGECTNCVSLFWQTSSVNYPLSGALATFLPDISTFYQVSAGGASRNYSVYF